MKRLDILVAYDVNTESKEGQVRLRKVATICKNFGQRVQYSLFECSVTKVQLEDLVAQLENIIDKRLDSLRIYTLHGGREKAIRVFGRDRYIDYDEPLIL